MGSGSVSSHFLSVPPSSSLSLLDRQATASEGDAQGVRDAWTVPARHGYPGIRPICPSTSSGPLRGPEAGKPIRVAFVVDPAGQGTAKQVQDGVRKAAASLEDTGYAVEEAEPPSIVAAAKTTLDMLNTPEFRAPWQMMSHLLSADTQRFLSAFYEVAGDPDPVTAIQSFMSRQSLLRAWGEFQEQHPLIVAPIFTGIPFEAGTDLANSRVAETIHGMRMAITVNALGLPAVALPVGTGDGPPQSVQVIGLVTARTCASMPRRRWRTGSASLRPELL